MKTIIKGEWEDEIYRVRAFIKELAKIQDNYLEELFEMLKKDGICTVFNSDEEIKDFLFDFIHNCDEQIQFEEFLYKYM